MLIEIAKGMVLTLKNMLSRPITLQWPEEQKPAPPRHRGRHILHRYDNGLEKCIGCELCAAACPVGCIYVGPAENPKDHPFSPGERYAERYEINLMRCIYCGYCAEACPTEAITLGPRYDLSDYRRERTVVTKAELLEAWPHFDQARISASPEGVGADQRGRELLDPGVSPRLAWDAAQRARGDAPASAGAHGIAPHPPSVAEPPRRPATGAGGGGRE
jgi:NADH-quinone oxidoreductase subunit I